MILLHLYCHVHPHLSHIWHCCKHTCKHVYHLVSVKGINPGGPFKP